MVLERWTQLPQTSLLSLTEETPTPAAKPKKVYTPEEKAAILRGIRRTNMIVLAVTVLIAVLGVGLVHVQTQSVALAGLTAVVVAGYLIYREVQLRRKKPD